MSPRSVFYRWAFFGAMDGTLTHAWYRVVEEISAFVSGGDPTPMKEVASSVIATSMVYTPMYCVLFLSISALWDGKGMDGVRKVIRDKLPTMTTATLPTWTVFNTFLFACVPLQFRVLTCEAFHYLYLVVLALWERQSGTVSMDHGFTEAETAAVVIPEHFALVQEEKPGMFPHTPQPVCEGSFGASSELGLTGSSFNTWGATGGNEASVGRISVAKSAKRPTAASNIGDLGNQPIPDLLMTRKSVSQRQ